MQRWIVWFVLLLTLGSVTVGTRQTETESDVAHALDGSGGGPPPSVP